MLEASDPCSLNPEKYFETLIEQNESLTKIIVPGIFARRDITTRWLNIQGKQLKMKND